jgi:transposase-like protein
MGKRYKATVRERLVDAVRTSGESVKVVAERMGVKDSTAYYWMKRSRATTLPEFARVVPASAGVRASMSIEVAGVAIHLEPGFDAELLREVVSALGRSST